mgnify:CR=1 FL=1
MNIRRGGSVQIPDGGQGSVFRVLFNIFVFFFFPYKIVKHIFKSQEAFDSIMNIRRGGSVQIPDGGFSEVRRQLQNGNYNDADSMLEGIGEKTAEWYFLLLFPRRRKLALHLKFCKDRSYQICGTQPLSFLFKRSKDQFSAFYSISSTVCLYRRRFWRCGKGLPRRRFQSACYRKSND